MVLVKVKKHEVWICIVFLPNELRILLLGLLDCLLNNSGLRLLAYVLSLCYQYIGLTFLHFTLL